MSYKYVVLGTGVGKAIAYALLKNDDTGSVIIADINEKKALDTVQWLKKLLPRSSAECRGVRYSFEEGRIDNVSIRDWFSDAHVVISAYPAKFNFGLAREAINAGVHFCDLGGVVEITRQMTQRLNVSAQDRGVSVIPDCGFMPGLGVLIARKLMEEFEATEEITIWAGGLPQKPRPPVFYQKVFSLEGLKHICYDEAPVLRDGRIIWMKPFSGQKSECIPELARFSTRFCDEVETFITAGASIAPWTFQKWGVENFTERTVRWPGFVGFVRGRVRSPDDFEQVISPHINIPVCREYPDFVWLAVEATGVSGSTRLVKRATILDTFDEKSGLSAMERATGFPTAVIARMQAEGSMKKGVYTPEQAFSSPELARLFEAVNAILPVSFL